jgi:ABC-type Mn2+/Zn2+ transport system ATPase subunit
MSRTEAYAVKVEGLSVTYDKKRVLANIYLELEQGKVYGVLGPNGAGKSTLFKSLLELVDYDYGKIKLLGKKVDKVRKEIAYVPQRDEIDRSFPASVMDVVLMGRYPFKKVFQRLNAEDKELARQALEKVDLLEYADSSIGSLSGGQQQRTLLARALCQGASLFLLDEPFVGVDATTESKVVELIKDEAEKGHTVLVVHHDLSTVTSYFDEVILLNQHLIGSGPVEDVFTEENLAKCYGAQLPILHKAKKED